MSAGSFGKDPIEQFPVGLDMRGQLPTGRVVTRGTASAVDVADNSAASSVLVRTSATITSERFVDIPVKAGTADHRYKLIFDIWDDANNHYRETLIMLVRAE